MTRQIIVSSLAVLALGALAVACKAGGVGDPCIPNLEYSPGYQGDDEGGASIEDRSFQCETRVCIINHFRGRVSCPFGNTSGGSTFSPDNSECFVPGTNVKVTASVKPQCNSRKDNVYCSCLCGHQEKGAEAKDPAIKYCECPDGFVCDVVTNSLNPDVMRPGDEYCVRSGSGGVNNFQQDGQQCCPSSGSCTDSCDQRPDHCGYSSNSAKLN